MENSKRDGDNRSLYLPPEKPVYKSRAIVQTRHGTTDWFQIGEGVHQGCYCYSAYLTYMQSISCEMPEWMTLESRLVGEISGFPGGSDSKESACNAGDLSSIPGSERSPGGGHGNPRQCSCLENPHEQKSLWTTVHGVTKSWTRLTD